MFKSPSELPINRMYDEYFWVRYNFLYSRTKEDLQYKGIRHSTYEEFNKTIDKDEIQTQINISQMFDLFQRGVTVKLMNYNDTATIYEIVHTHLKHCREYIMTAIHSADEEFVKELIELDNFASRVYDKAVNVFSDEDVFNFNAPGTPFVQRLNSMNVFKRTPNKVISVTGGAQGKITTENKDPSKVKIQERNPLRDSFASHLDQLSGWKKPDGQV